MWLKLSILTLSEWYLAETFGSRSFIFLTLWHKLFFMMQHCGTDCSSTIIAHYLIRLWTTVATRLQARIWKHHEQPSARVNVLIARARNSIWGYLQPIPSYLESFFSTEATRVKICRVCGLQARSGPQELHNNFFFFFYGDPPKHTLAVVKINPEQQKLWHPPPCERTCWHVSLITL